MSTCGEPCDGCPNRAEHHLCDACCHDEVNAIQKENRELRAEVERLERELKVEQGFTNDYIKRFQAAANERHDALIEVTFLKNALAVLKTTVHVEHEKQLLAEASKLAQEAYSRGAEAMREAAARLVDESLSHTLTDAADRIRALPIPEDEP